MKKRGSAQVKEKSVYLGVIAVLVLVIVFMSFSTDTSFSSRAANSQLMEMQLVQLLSQENVLLVDASVALNKLNPNLMINSCANGVTDYLAGEGLISEEDKYTVISVISDGFDDVMIPDGPGKRRPFCPT